MYRRRVLEAMGAGALAAGGLAGCLGGGTRTRTAKPWTYPPDRGDLDLLDHETGTKTGSATLPGGGEAELEVTWHAFAFDYMSGKYGAGTLATPQVSMAGINFVGFTNRTWTEIMNDGSTRDQLVNSLGLATGDVSASMQAPKQVDQASVGDGPYAQETAVQTWAMNDGENTLLVNVAKGVLERSENDDVFVTGIGLQRGVVPGENGNYVGTGDDDVFDPREVDEQREAHLELLRGGIVEIDPEKITTGTPRTTTSTPTSTPTTTSSPEPPGVDLDVLHDRMLGVAETKRRHADLVPKVAAAEGTLRHLQLIALGYYARGEWNREQLERYDIDAPRRESLGSNLEQYRGEFDPTKYREIRDQYRELLEKETRARDQLRTAQTRLFETLQSGREGLGQHLDATFDSVWGSGETTLMGNLVDTLANTDTYPVVTTDVVEFFPPLCTIKCINAEARIEVGSGGWYNPFGHAWIEVSTTWQITCGELSSTYTTTYSRGFYGPSSGWGKAKIKDDSGISRVCVADRTSITCSQAASLISNIKSDKRRQNDGKPGNDLTYRLPSNNCLDWALSKYSAVAPARTINKLDDKADEPEQPCDLCPGGC